MKNIFCNISIVLSIAALIMFLHISVVIPIWGNVAYYMLCAANIVSCFIADRKFSEGKLAFSPILSLVAQLALSFGVLALVS